VEEPSKGTKLGGLKAFMEYKIHPQLPGSRVVGRRYKQFDWLHEQLVNKFRFICVPPLPGKQIAGKKI
jgi:sorting nexin-9/18/33